jgi:hypothetical protein
MRQAHVYKAMFDDTFFHADESLFRSVNFTSLKAGLGGRWITRSPCSIQLTIKCGSVAE